MLVQIKYLGRIIINIIVWEHDGLFPETHIA